jgi:glyoxylase-like metal-dependent hydrolase (beta-lactamase superfamily II)
VDSLDIARTDQTWQIGNVVISAIPEFVTWPVDDLIPDATPESCARFADWLPSQFLCPEGLQLTIQCFLVESQGRRIVVDTCIGNGKRRNNPRLDRLNRPFLKWFEQVAGQPESVDLVLCTHLHSDHVGWNTLWHDQRWVPTFPNARYLLNSVEVEYARDVTDGDAPEVFADSVQPLFDQDLVDVVTSDQQLTDEISLMSTAGHTVGHVSVWIESGDQHAVITGDALHHPVQVAEPGWRSKNDYDAGQAAESRQAITERCLTNDALLLGAHFVAPSGARLRQHGGICVPDFAVT